MATLNPHALVTNYTEYSLNVSQGTKLDDEPENSFWNSTTLNKTAPVLLVMIATIIGNSALIISLTHKASRRRKRVNIFIVNLAVADLAVAFITMTTELLEAIFKQWVLGAFMCKYLLYCQGVTLSSTTFMLTGMSIDRYQVIVKPFRSITNRPNIKAKVIVAWALAFIFAIPQCFIFVQVDDPDEILNKTVHHCRSAGYSAEWQRKFYFTFQTFYVLVFPAGIMLFCYTTIVRTIWNRGEGSNRSPSVSCKKLSYSPRVSLKRSVISSSRRRVVFMTLSVIVAYIVCLTPYFIICLMRIYSNYELMLKDELAVSQIIFMLHSALNPFLYGLFTIRKRQILNLCHCSKDDRFSARHSIDSSDRGNFIQLKTHRRSATFRLVNCFSQRNSQETDVILKNHIAKEETIIKLKNRENNKYYTSVRGQHEMRKNSATWTGQNGVISNFCSRYSTSTPSKRHSAFVMENSSVISDV